MGIDFDGFAPDQLAGEQLDAQVQQVVAFALDYSARGRELAKLSDNTFIKVTLPYNPGLRHVFELAEQRLAPQAVLFDWRHFQRWDIPRELAGDFDPARHVWVERPDQGPAVAYVRLPGDDAELTAAAARERAAQLMAAAEYMDTRQMQGE